MFQKIKPYGLIVASILLIILLLQKIHWFPTFSNFFKSKPLIIDNTPVLIREIHNISQIITISMYDEVVINSSKPKHLPSLPGLRPVPDNIVLIGKGKVLAGVDLAKINEKSLSVTGDSVSVLLPGAEIFSTIVNPSGFEIFDEAGKWSQQEVTEIKKEIRSKITVRALENRVLSKAHQRCKLILENFLRSLGFKKIYFVPEN